MKKLKKLSTIVIYVYGGGGLKEITKIVITGGPCAGKTTVMQKIKTAFSKKGYAVLTIAETATELIGSGIAPWTVKSSFDYQFCQMKLQLEKERIFGETAQLLVGSEKVLIVCDRGILDNRAYMTENEFLFALDKLNLSEEVAFEKYNGVFHLMSIAKSNAADYTISNNFARTETAGEAADIDDKTIEAWKNHPHFKIIDNYESFEQKADKLIEEICFLIEGKE